MIIENIRIYIYKIISEITYFQADMHVFGVIPRPPEHSSRVFCLEPYMKFFKIARREVIVWELSGVVSDPLSTIKDDVGVTVDGWVQGAWGRSRSLTTLSWGGWNIWLIFCQN